MNNTFCSMRSIGVSKGSQDRIGWKLPRISKLIVQCDQPKSWDAFFSKTATQKGQKHPSFNPGAVFHLRGFQS